MRVIGISVIEQHKRKHPDSRSALDRWLRLVRENDFGNFVEIRKLFPRADLVGVKTVFDVGGNKARVIALVNYPLRQVIVTHALTHAEYDKTRWKS